MAIVKTLGAANAPAGSAAAITKSDSTELTPIPRAIYVGVTGDITITLADSQNDVVFKAVPAGTILPVAAWKVKAATTATDLVALW